MSDNFEKKEINVATFKTDSNIENIPIYYSNNINVTTGLHDVKLTFGKTDLDNLTINTDVSIYLSLQSTKQLLKILEDHINGYENDFGIINLEIKKKK